VPVRLLRDGVEIERTLLELPRGEALRTWEAAITTGVAGSMTLELAIGEGTQLVAKRALTTVADRLVTRVLFYQGALDWGFRFFRDALAEDENFEVSSLFSPSVGVRLQSGGKAGFANLPATAAELAPFNLVVLSNVRHDQFNAAQEQALLGYVRNGGGLLMILPDTEAAGGFAGSTLEAMLPVAFGRPAPERPEDRRARTFQMQMRGTAGNEPEAMFANSMVGQNEVSPLRPFEVVPGTSLEKLFQAGDQAIEPRFTQSAHVRQVKAAAEILAVSNDGGGATGEPLMVAQPFGRGRSTVLVSDMLWRWSLSEPSDRQTARNFWQQLTVWLAQPAGQVLRFLDSYGEITAHTPIPLRLESADAGAPAVTALGPDGVRTALSVVRDGDRLWRADLTPGESGTWTIEATGDKDAEARMTVSVVPAEGVKEDQVRPPDVGRLRAMAEATAGQLLDSDAPEAWKRAPGAAPETLLSERRTLLWNEWLLFLPMLGLYGAELLLRRQLRLV
jgi:hypothetical protein